MQSLKFLDVSYNMLRYLPESIGMCKSLCVLKAVGNKIETIPESIGELYATLEVLELNENAIRFLPKGQFGMLERLLTLNLDNNQLVEVPACFQNFKCLQTLSIAKNRI